MESFNVLQQGESYRMIVCEIKEGQNPDAAISVNPPLYLANFLTRHEVMYPQDAPTLEQGKRFAWQVQKVVNGVITNRTEAWEFTIKSTKSSANITFVEITPGLNATPFDVTDDFIYFVYKEEYIASNPELRAFYFSKDNRQVELIPVSYVDPKLKNIDVGKVINNKYKLDLTELRLSEGVYTLKILNEKNQEFLLKFRYNKL